MNNLESKPLKEYTNNELMKEIERRVVNKEMKLLEAMSPVWAVNVTNYQDK